MAGKKASSAKWSQRVTTTSDAMDIESGTFRSDDPENIARALEKDAESSTRLKGTPYRSAMSMLSFYINRAGRNLTDEHRQTLEAAKEVLRTQFGPDVAKNKAVAADRASKKRAVRRTTKKKPRDDA